jgi:hypothetical protein
MNNKKKKTFHVKTTNISLDWQTPTLVRKRSYQIVDNKLLAEKMKMQLETGT